MTAGIFVTGTDTGVGKTVVAASLARGLVARGLAVGVMKPAETGCPWVDGRLVAPDTAFLRAAADYPAAEELVNPYAFAEPLAPALAAERAGTAIDSDLISAAYRRLAAAHDVVLVEGAGGLLTPLTAELTMAGLATLLGLPIIVVARNCLGAINHTALTVRAAQGEGLRVLGVVLNHPDPNADLAARTNAEALRRWAGAPLLGCVPYLMAPSPAAAGEGGGEGGPDLDALAASAAPIAEVLLASLGLDSFIVGGDALSQPSTQSPSTTSFRRAISQRKRDS